MSAREIGFMTLLLLAGALITTGASLVFVPAGFIVGGGLLAAWSWLVLADDGSAEA